MGHAAMVIRRQQIAGSGAMLQWLVSAALIQYSALRRLWTWRLIL